MSLAKWIISGLLPAFAAGSALLTTRPQPDFVFWWAVAAAFCAGLTGKGINGGIDNAKQRKSK
jgi:hypothetical protein